MEIKSKISWIIIGINTVLITSYFITKEMNFLWVGVGVTIGNAIHITFSKNK